jgi:hypothetical protein
MVSPKRLAEVEVLAAGLERLDHLDGAMDGVAFLVGSQQQGE